MNEDKTFKALCKWDFASVQELIYSWRLDTPESWTSTWLQQKLDVQRKVIEHTGWTPEEFTAERLDRKSQVSKKISF